MGASVPTIEEALSYADGWMDGLRAAGNTEVADLIIARDAMETKMLAERAIAMCERRAVEELESRLAAAEARAEKAEKDLTALSEVLDSIRVYGSDTLSGPINRLADAAWYREAVTEMRNRALIAAFKEQGGE
jgi:hypothetical protein